jgi:hypothetical protein
VIGAGTVRADDPQLTTREVEGPSPVRVVLDTDRRLDARYRQGEMEPGTPAERGRVPGILRPGDDHGRRSRCRGHQSVVAGAVSGECFSDPFPVRADGTRFEVPYRNALGSMMVAGTNYTYGNLQFEHASVHRWRGGVQRELSSNMSMEVVYSGMYSGNAALNVRQDVLPEKYWNSTKTRNAPLASDLNSNVPNPYYIGNFPALKTSDPLLYSRLNSVSLFTSTTIPKNELLRPFSEMTNLTAANLPLRKARVHSLDATFQRRFAGGLSLNAALSLNKGDEFATVLNEYDLAPTQWLSSNNSRPYRLTAYGLYELPFGKGRRLSPGLVVAIEPMINAGTAEVLVKDDGWTAVTKDGSLSAHFEHSVAITDDGPFVLSRA